jgi:hypothetical protein
MMVDSGREASKLCMCGVTDEQRKATVGAHLGRHVLAGRGGRRVAPAETRKSDGPAQAPPPRSDDIDTR